MIQADSQKIPLKLQRALLFTPVRELTTWELDNLPRVMLTADQPWNPSTISDYLDGQVVYPDEDDILDDDMQAFVFQACKDMKTGEHMNDEQMDNPLNYWWP